MNHYAPSPLTTQESLPSEEWREIPGYNGRYEVSNYGRARSWYWGAGTKSKSQDTPYYLNQGVNGNGYIYFRLRKDGKFGCALAHRLVMLAFVGPSSLAVNHKDGNKQNNMLDNLEYVTRRENVQHAIHVLGIRWSNRQPKPPTERDIEIRALVASGVRQCEIAKRFGISQAYVSQIVSGKYRSGTA